MARVMTSSDACQHFDEVLRQVIAEEQPLILTHDGVESAVVLSMAEYQRMLASQPEPALSSAHRDPTSGDADLAKWNLAAWLADLDQFHAQLRAELNGRSLPPADEVIRQMREERDAEIDAALR